MEHLDIFEDKLYCPISCHHVKTKNIDIYMFGEQHTQLTEYIKKKYGKVK